MDADVAWALAWALCAAVGIGLHTGLAIIARNDWWGFARHLPPEHLTRTYVCGMLRAAALGGTAKLCFLAVAVVVLGVRAEWWGPPPGWVVPGGLIVGLALLDTHTALVLRDRWRLRYRPAAAGGGAMGPGAG